MFHVKPSESMESRHGRLHLFDLDGTLIRGSAAAVEISRQLGLLEEIAALEEGFLRGLTPDEFAVRARDLWSTLTPEQVDAAFEGAPWLTGIREVWAEIKARGERCAVISLSPDFFVERLLDWGVDTVHGSRWPAVPFTEPIHRPGILDAAAKVRIARELCTEYGVEWADCVAYGDSMSDAELFAIVRDTVAVNADHHLAGISRHSYAGGDLREAYDLVRNRAA
ncbi:Phosphoserine phosphatase [Streptomyces venezuelae]|uniref:HAD family hydrolase n=1 Tax=Streptomyces gardneri TaxID=66892 RepID=UPI0006E15CFA|nr:HAD-IB family phosphatase [Streptomyces gardneri]ALO09705.1 Phosphoserine phosphatase [Streptomyces venezuelae]QPK46776.1 HAD family phosphatase [Streptomyces gardneri]WRK38176.1 HAD-IB family phosphatase [Streptomyces venezuelae]